jgi:hypothetical protein
VDDTQVGTPCQFASPRRQRLHDRVQMDLVIQAKGKAMVEDKCIVATYDEVGAVDFNWIAISYEILDPFPDDPKAIA